LSKAARWALLAAIGWVLCFFLLIRVFAVSGPNEYWVLQALVLAVLLVVSGWLTGRAKAARNRE
jgi:hypothetical protein